MDQETLTKVFINQLGEAISEVNVKFYSQKWWFSNRTSKKSFRLSHEGYLLLTKTFKLEEYFIPLSGGVWDNVSTIIFLEKYIDCPYYLCYKGVSVFSQKMSTELFFFSNDIQRFGISKAIKERGKS